jgi:hypothetical protein
MSISVRPALPLAVLATILLSGCATELTFRRREALDHFVGKDRAFVENRLGTPTSVTQQGGSLLLNYAHDEEKWYPGQPHSRSTDGGAMVPWVADSQCTTTFRLDAGRVDAWKLEGNDCRAQTFPLAASNISGALEATEHEGVDAAANFPHDTYTARSAVNYGQFYGN